MPIDEAKLAKLKASKGSARKCGGARRKAPTTQKNNQTANDSRKLQLSLKKIAHTPIDTIDEVNMFKDNGEVIHFNNPQVFCAPGSNTFTIAGANSTKKISEMPQILNQLGLEGLQAWAKSAETNKLLKEMGAGMSSQAAAMGIDKDVKDFDAPEADDVE